MFNPIINWQVYFTVCGAILALYYAVILLLFYSKGRFKISPINSAGKSDSLTRQFSLFPNENSTPTLPPNNQPGVDLRQIAKDLANELKAYLLQSGKQSAGKYQVVTAIKIILQKYPSLRESEYQQGITKLVAAECETHCNIFLNADELIALWNKND